MDPDVPSVRSRPTSLGWVALVGALALTQLGALGGHNLVLSVAAGAWAAGAVAWVAGRRNLSGLTVSWRLPTELFAGQRAHGAFHVRAAHGLTGAVISDGLASTHVTLGPGEHEVRASWRADVRGIHSLGPILVRSMHPLGLFEHTVVHGNPTEIVVWPRPAAFARSRSPAQGTQRADEWRGLRPYRAGESWRRVHARSSARRGRPLVLELGGAGTRAHHITLRDSSEPAISRATAEVLAATESGQRVGMHLAHRADLATPRAGGAWRRTLLDALARVGR